MPLGPGLRLGPYEILEPLGAGGMGEVYRAKDTRLDRLVAIKVLPGHLSADPALRERFDREARAISSLSHPHICALHDVGHQDGVDFLVMEFLDGQTLADRLSGGPLPLEETLRVGRQIAEALAAAHRAGVVHRDLKPGNVMLTRDGVKLLDFGLAKMGVESATPASSLTMRTQSSHKTPLTAEGTILGTFQYMAPEQLEGEEADTRTDIFALGAVLYEMLTGRRAFEGKSQASLIASIMSANPAPISQLVPLTPPALDRVVRTCLKKNPDERWQTAHDVALQLEWIAEGGSAAGLPAPVAHRRRSRERAAWGIAAVLGLALAAAVSWYALNRPVEPARHMLRYQVPVPAGVSAVNSPKLSPDGRYMAFNATDTTGKAMLWVQPLNALTANPLPGTEGARRAIWSPDSRSVAFFAQGKLRRVDIAGGPAQILCEAATGADGAWSPQGVILFDGNASDSLRRVPDTGGIPEAATVLDHADHEQADAWPYFLPDGKHFLFQVQYSDNRPAAIKVGELGSFKAKDLEKTDSRMEYVPPGYILWVQDRTLLAREFDAGSLKFTGAPFPVLESIGSGSLGLAQFSTSRDGMLAYRQQYQSNDHLVLVDRTGHVSTLSFGVAHFGDPALSPDGHRVAVEMTDPGNGMNDLWILDLDRGTRTRLTLDPGDDVVGVWSPDGRQVAFASNRGGQYDIYVKAADGTGSATPVFQSGNYKEPCSWSPDGKYILFHTLDPKTRWDVLAVPAAGGDSIVVAGGAFSQGKPAVSPDGRWLAYQSNETGKAQIYVQALPRASGKWQVSIDGGTEPFWTEHGREICYLDAERYLMTVEVTVDTGGGVRTGAPVRRFRMPVSSDNATRNRWCPAAAGDRFLAVSPNSSAELPPTTIMVNWVDELTRRR